MTYLCLEPVIWLTSQFVGKSFEISVMMCLVRVIDDRTFICAYSIKYWRDPLLASRKTDEVVDFAKANHTHSLFPSFEAKDISSTDTSHSHASSATTASV